MQPICFPLPKVCLLAFPNQRCDDFLLFIFAENVSVTNAFVSVREAVAFFQLHRPRLVNVDELPALTLEAAQMCNMSLTLFQKFVNNLTLFFFYLRRICFFSTENLTKLGSSPMPH